LEELIVGNVQGDVFGKSRESTAKHYLPIGLRDNVDLLAALVYSKRFQANLAL
jgi:hypothetical protein